MAVAVRCLKGIGINVTLNDTEINRGARLRESCRLSDKSAGRQSRGAQGLLVGHHHAIATSAFGLIESQISRFEQFIRHPV